LDPSAVELECARPFDAVGAEETGHIFVVMLAVKTLRMVLFEARDNKTVALVAAGVNDNVLAAHYDYKLRREFWVGSGCTYLLWSGFRNMKDGC
jgi:hypothetical protein